MHQRCGKCHTKFRYKSIQKEFLWGEWSGEKSFKCENCETEHVLSNYKILFLMFALPLFFIWIPYVNPSGKGFIIVTIYILIFILIVPFIFRFKVLKKD